MQLSVYYYETYTIFNVQTKNAAAWADPDRGVSSCWCAFPSQGDPHAAEARSVMTRIAFSSGHGLSFSQLWRVTFFRTYDGNCESVKYPRLQNWWKLKHTGLLQFEAMSQFEVHRFGQTKYLRMMEARRSKRRKK